MKLLSLNEKITIKGLLVRQGVPVSNLIKFKYRRDVLFFWNRVYGKPITSYAKYI